MGEGIDLAVGGDKELARHMENLRDQLLIVFLKRMGGKVTIPVAEIDDTGNDLFKIDIDPLSHEFTFEVVKKS